MQQEVQAQESIEPYYNYDGYTAYQEWIYIRQKFQRVIEIR